jgi:phosphatidylglycerophosphatase A
MNRIILWVAQGFGTGRMPVAPGTFGTVVGIPWAFLLLSLGSLEFYLVGMVAGFLASVWLCTRAEDILNRHDPASVVVDEIVAMPLAMLPLMLHTQTTLGHFPGVIHLMNVPGWTAIGLAFGLFRLFDIWKPWPVRQSQCLTRGLGVTMDDLLAAVYAAGVLFVVYQMGWLR